MTMKQQFNHLPANPHQVNILVMYTHLSSWTYSDFLIGYNKDAAGVKQVTVLDQSQATKALPWQMADQKICFCP